MAIMRNPYTENTQRFFMNFLVNFHLFTKTSWNLLSCISAPVLMADGEQNKQLFISYGRETDVIEFVAKLKCDLESNGFSVWLDNHMMNTQADSDSVGSGLHKCQAIVPIITPKYINSRYCINELYTADDDEKLIFPIIFKDVDLNSSDMAMGVKFVISSVNWTFCRTEDDYYSNIHKFMAGMRAKGIGSDDREGPGSSSSSQSQSALPPAPLVGPGDTSKPLFWIPDVEMIQGITTGPAGEIICSSAQHKIFMFTRDGQKLHSFGTLGMKPEDLVAPSGVAVNSDGHLLVACYPSIKKFSMEGKLIEQYGGYAAKHDDPCKLDGPSALAIGQNGRVYVSELQPRWAHKVKIFDSDLKFVSSFTDACPDLGSGRLNTPVALAVNSEGHVYVADMLNGVIQVFSADGEYLFNFGKTGAGSTNSPSSIAIDRDDYVYVGRGMCTVSIFDKEGKFIRMFGGHGSELGKFNHPRAMHVDQEGKLYVGEWTTNRLQVFK